MGKSKKEVVEYIERQKSPQKEIIKKLRRIILRTLPHIKEEMKMGVPWYEGRVYIVALKDHVNLGFCIEGLSEEETRILEGAGKTMKHIKIHSPRDIDQKKIEKLLRKIGKK
jgi:hypothetical protein